MSQKNSMMNKIFSVILIASAIYIFIQARFGFDLDLVWHYLLGEDIVTSGKILFENKYSWIEGTYWNQHEWLFDVVFYVVVKNAGLVGYSILYIAAIATLIYMGYRINKQNIKSTTMYLMTSLFLMIVIPMTQINRPSDFSTLLLPLLLYLYSYDRTGKQVKISAFVFFISGIFVANFHCAQGIAILAMLFVRYVLDAVFSLFLKRKSVKYFIHKFGYMMLYLFGMCINILGPKQIINVFKVLDMNSTDYIQEWRAIPLTNYVTIITLILIIMSFGHALANRRKSLIILGEEVSTPEYEERVLTNLALICATLVITMYSAKSSVLFVYMFICFGYQYFEKMITDCLKIITKKEVEIPSVSNKVLVSGIIVGCIFGTLSFLTNGMTFEDYVHKNQSQIISDDIITCVQSEEDVRLLHSYNIANYMMFNDIPVIVDTRQQPYARENGYSETCDDVFYLMYQAKSNEDVESIISKYDINMVLCDKSMNLCWYFENNSNYELIAEDEFGNVVFKRLFEVSY